MALGAAMMVMWGRQFFMEWPRLNTLLIAVHMCVFLAEQKLLHRANVSTARQKELKSVERIGTRSADRR